MAMAYNVLLKEDRKALIDEIYGEENKKRKRESFKQTEVYNGRLSQYVEEYLKSQFDSDTVKEMTKISSINIQRRIVKSESTVYKKAPIRKFMNVTQDQELAIQKIYKDMKANAKLRRSNESFKLQKQNFIQIMPKKGKLIARVLRQHHIDAIPDLDDPETAIAYILSGFDSSYVKDSKRPETPTGYIGRSSPNTSGSDWINQTIADEDDYKSTLERLVYWDSRFHFKMNREGIIILDDGSQIEDVSEDLLPLIVSPLAEYDIMPFIEISGEKDFEFFIRQEQDTTEFTIQFNGTLSDLAQIVKLQGYAQAILTGPEEMMTETMRVGPNIILKLVVDPDKKIEPNFQYANPNPDIAGSLDFVKIFLSLFLSSKGIDPKIISSTGESISYSSGIERLLAMFEKFEATQDDFDIYADAESDMFKIISSWHNVLSGTDSLERKYSTSKISDDAEIKVIYDNPESIQTESERVSNFTAKHEAELASRAEYFAKNEHLNHKQAIARAVMVRVDEALIDKFSTLQGHLHENLGPSIITNDGNHTHLDLTSGELVVPSLDTLDHTHILIDGNRSEKPIRIDESDINKDEELDGMEGTDVQPRGEYPRN